MPFQKGQSGNPGGRSSDKEWKAAIRKAVHATAGNRKKLDALADKLVAQGLTGDVQAIKEIGDRLDGKVPQAHAGPDGEGPVRIMFEWQTAPSDA